MTKSVDRSRNWMHYNDALGRRGSLALWVDPAVLSAWRSQGPSRRGARFEYGDLAIVGLLTLRAVYHLTLRAAEGSAASLFELMDSELPVPDSGTLSRRAARGGIAIPERAPGPLHRVVDTTGLKVYGEGEWKVRRHGYSKRRTWLKLHLAIDPEAHEVPALVVSGPAVTDAEAVPDLWGRVKRPPASMTADGAYDRRTGYAELESRKAGAVIPPRRGAKIGRHGNATEPRLARDENLRRIRRVGRERWKRESGYRRRSLGETAMSRMKALFGGGVSSRRPLRQAAEVAIRCRAMNIMTRRGMPPSERVAA